MFYSKVETVAELTRDIEVLLLDHGWNIWELVIPKGFVTDGASIPKVCWYFIGHPFGKYLKAALVHDYLCRQAKSYQERMVADATFFLMLHREKVRYWRRTAMYFAVRCAARYEWRVTPDQKNSYARFSS